jgi:hypothetical protein
MTNDFSLDLEDVLVLGSHASIAVSAAVDASVAEGAADAADVEGVAVAAGADAAVVNERLGYRFQMDPCVRVQGSYFIPYLYIRDKVSFIRW